jgi:hypothetical protein
VKLLYFYFFAEVGIEPRALDVRQVLYYFSHGPCPLVCILFLSYLANFALAGLELEIFLSLPPK